MKRLLKKIETFARDLRPGQTDQRRFPEATAADLRNMASVREFTMTSQERLWALVSAVRYVEGRNLEGDYVECGVWRGGSIMTAALTLIELGVRTRDIWLFDTFEGMSKPTAEDVSLKDGRHAGEKWLATRTGDDSAAWCDAGIDEVARNVARTGYPRERLRFVKGKVEDTLRDTDHLPGRIALLRLDTDWYASTKAEMEVLFPRLVAGGVLILDDYGHWAGSKQAVDEYFASHGLHYLLNRTDRAGRMMIKD